MATISAHTFVMKLHATQTYFLTSIHTQQVKIKFVVYKVM